MRTLVFVLFFIVCLPIYSDDSDILKLFQKYIESSQEWMGNVGYSNIRSKPVWETLAESTDPKLTQAILQSLKSSDPAERAAAIHIASLKKDEALLDALFESINTQVELINSIERRLKANKTENIETVDGNMMSEVSHSIHVACIELSERMNPKEFRRFFPLLSKEGMGNSFVQFPLADGYSRLAAKHPELLSDGAYLATLYKTVMEGKNQSPNRIMHNLIPHFSEMAKNNETQLLDIAEKIYGNGFPGGHLTAIEIAKHFNHKRATKLLQKISVVSSDGKYVRAEAKKILRSQGRRCGVLGYLGAILPF